MLKSNLSNALIAALMAGVIVAPIFGLQIVTKGMHTHLKPEWNMIIAGMVIVFVFQLMRPWIKSRMGRRVALPSLPSLTDAGRHKAIIFLILISLVWPFFGNRSQEIGKASFREKVCQYG